MSSSPLAGIKVLDLTTTVVGPACTLRLAQYGAEVIKVEAQGGDLMRTLGGASPTGQHSGSYLHLNRGKRSVCLDLKSPGGIEVMQRLLDQADVFVTNMRPAALERLGLDAERARSARPRLIHCLISGFGAQGPYAGMSAYDSVVQGASGVAGLGEARDGRPAYAPLLLCDHIVGEIASGAVIAALYERERTGRGAGLEIPMFETMAAFVLQEHMGRQSFDPPIGPAGDMRLLEPNNRPIRTSDGWISLTSNTDAQTHALLRTIGRPELIDDPRFRTVADRVRNADAWFAMRETALLGRTTEEWLQAFRQADVPAMPCHSLESLVQDEHLRAVELIQEDVHPTEGAVRGLRSTILSDGAAAELGPAAQPIGWDTAEVLREAGLQPAEIEALIAARAAIDGRQG